MKKILLPFIALFINISGIVYAQETGIVPGNLLVMLHSDEDAIMLTEELQYLSGIKTDLKVERVLSESMHIYLFNFNTAVIAHERMLRLVKNNPLVLIAQSNHIFQERIIPNDTQFGVMWGMHNTGQSSGTVDADIDAPQAWDITTGGLTSLGDTIVVAVIDGGYDLAQQDLNYWKNYKEIANNGIDDDNNGYKDDRDGWNGANKSDNWTVQNHGTHVAGTVGAKGNNGIGVTGVNWNVKVMAVSNSGTGGGGLESNTIASYAYVRDQRALYNKTSGAKGAFVVSTNSSFGVDLGKPADYPIWCAMYDSLGLVGILSAGATANANNNVDTQGDIPTACASKWLVTVTNTTRTDSKATAGYGATTIDLGAPGSSIVSTYPSNAYSLSSGTSMATPHVAGAIALMYSVPCSPLITNYKNNPSAVALIIKDSLLKATDPIAALSGITVTGGRLNLFKAVKSIQNYCISVSAPGDRTSLDNKFEIKNAYPNPASNMINIVYSSNDAVDISIVNVLGQEVKRLHKDTRGIQHAYIDMDSIDKGIYFVALIGKEGKSKAFKIIVN